MDNYYFKRRAERLEEVLRRRERNDRLLDLGCGSGVFIQFAKRLGFKNIYGSDVTPLLLKAAKKKGTRELTLADASKAPYKNETFDFIVLMDVIEHVKSPIGVLKESHRMLKTGGKIFATYPNPRMVPLLNILATLGAKIRSKEEKVYLEELEEDLKHCFEIESHEPMVLASKLPALMLRIVEKIEQRLPSYILNRVAIAYVLVMRKK